MKQLTKSKTIRFTETQINSLSILKNYNVNVNRFIRDAVKEKLQRDWKSIKEKKRTRLLPFLNKMLYLSQCDKKPINLFSPRLSTISRCRIRVAERKGLTYSWKNGRTS